MQCERKIWFALFFQDNKTIRFNTQTNVRYAFADPRMILDENGSLIVRKVTQGVIGNYKCVKVPSHSNKHAMEYIVKFKPTTNTPNPEIATDQVLQVSETKVSELRTKIQNSFVSPTKENIKLNKSMLDLDLNEFVSFENKSHEATQALLGMFYNAYNEKAWNDTQEAFKKPKELETTTKIWEIQGKSTISDIPPSDYWLIASCILLIALIIIIVLILIRILCSL
jgi:hypothetical protein